MRKLLLFAGLVAAGAVAVMVVRRFMSTGYERDEIDTGLGGGEFGDRGAPAPEQRWAPAETRHDISPEQLSMAARVGEAMSSLRQEWPAMSEEEINGAEGDLDRLAQLIAQKTEGSRDDIRKRLDEIITTVEPNPSYPAH